MSYECRVYRNTDPAAPITTLKRELGEVYAILKTCLCTGYGDKPSLGWELIYDAFPTTGEYKIAVRPLHSHRLGNGGAVWEFREFVQSGVVYIEVNTYDGYSSDGTAGTKLHRSYYFLNRTAYTASGNNWRLIGDGGFFYLLLESCFDYYFQAVFVCFGEMSNIQGDLFSLTLASNTPPSSWGANYYDADDLIQSDGRMIYFPKNLPRMYRNQLNPPIHYIPCDRGRVWQRMPIYHTGRDSTSPADLVYLPGFSFSHDSPAIDSAGIVEELDGRFIGAFACYYLYWIDTVSWRQLPWEL